VRFVPPRNVIATGVAVLLLAVATASAPADDTTTTTSVTTTTTTLPTEPTTTDPGTTATTETATTTAASTTTTERAPVAPTSRPMPSPRTEPRARKLETTTEVPPSPRRAHRRRHRISKPLRVTPPLGQAGYVFPVAGVAGYGDTYGAFRGDVHGKWHHGTDIFASLGTPVVAVASGTVNRVGWRKAGGWRVWVRDRSANQFYYAHLSGYASTLFHSRHVEAGEVIGFVGNTGDAYPGVAHLHFEIHPHQLLRLRYDGAVDPTTYLARWAHVQRVLAPRPKHPKLIMRVAARREARAVFRRLLVARGLVRETGPRPEAAPERISRAHRVVAGSPAASVAVPAAPDGQRPQLVEPLLGGVISLVLFAVLALLVRLARPDGRRRLGWRGRP